MLRILQHKRQGFRGIDAYTKLLLHMEGADGGVLFPDSSGNGFDYSAHGNAHTEADQKKFGSTSLQCDGDGDVIDRGTANAAFNFGTGDFTVDFWVRFSDLTNQQGLTGINYHVDELQWFFEKTSHATGDKLFFKAHTDSVEVANYIMTDAWAASVDTWYHLALVRHGAAIKIFIDGKSQALTENTAIGTNAVGLNVPPYIGVCLDGGEYWLNGFIDEYRLSKGIARWTAHFAPPESPYR